MMTLSAVVFIIAVIEFNIAGISAILSGLGEAIRGDEGSRYREKKDRRVGRRMLAAIILFVLAIMMSAAGLS